MNKNWTRWALWGCYALALAASWSHVKWAFELLEIGPSWIPGMAATAVDGGLFALAYSIQQRRRVEGKTWQLWIGVVSFAAISMFANWLHAQAALHGEGFAMTAGTRTLMAVAFSAVLPLLVLYLGEIVSAEDETAVAQKEKEEKRMKRAADKLQRESSALQRRIDELEQINTELQDEIGRRNDTVTGLEEFLQHLNPKAKHSLLYVAGSYSNMEEAATEAGVSKATISRMVGQLNGVSKQQ